MTNLDLKNKFEHLLGPLGFKKKGNTWKLQTLELEKVVELQKSSFSNLYYVCYGFNIKDLELNDVLIHVFRGLGSEDSALNKAIQETFDLQTSMDFLIRSKRITEFVTKIVVPEIMAVNDKSDLVTFLRRWKSLNTVPIRVKEHLNITV